MITTPIVVGIICVVLTLYVLVCVGNNTHGCLQGFNRLGNKKLIDDTLHVFDKNLSGWVTVESLSESEQRLVDKYCPWEHEVKSEEE